jgi:hypothetical protein
MGHASGGGAARTLEPRLGSSRAALAGAAVLVGALLVTFWGIGLPGWGLALTAFFAWAALPGIRLAQAVYASREWFAWLVGPVWGLTLSSLVALALWVAGLRHPSVLLLGPGLALALVRLSDRWRGLLEAPLFERRDLLCLVLVLLLVPTVVGRPYSRVGADVEDGRAYRAYFTADFVWKMAVAAEVAKGEVPPRNQYLAGEPLRYYWLPHLLSAVQHQALGSWVRLDRLLLVNGVLAGLAFMAFLYGFTRQFVPSAPWAAAGIWLAVWCGSYEGLERLVVYWVQGIPLDYVRHLNIDAVTRWFWGALPIDGLHRLLLYQPQHHAAAYATGFSGILALVQARAPGRPAVPLLAGACLAASVLLSAFSAVMVTAMVIPIALARLVHARVSLASLLRAGFVGALPIAAAILAAFALSYVDRSESLVELGWHPMSRNRLWPAFPMNFGAALPAMAGGLLWMAWVNPFGAVVLGTIVLGSFGFYFFVNVRDVQDVYVSWRAGHLLFMATAPLAGFVLLRVSTLWPALRTAIFTITAVLVVAALPTTLIDLFNTQDIENRSQGPGFRWTIVLSHDELEALEWVRRETPPRARVQIEPHVRDPETWAYIPAFGERRMAAGLPISMVPLTRYERASAAIQDLFRSDTPELAFTRAVDLGVDYIFLGHPERHTYPQFEWTLLRAPLLFPRVFQSTDGEVVIHQVGQALRPRAH